MSSGQTLLALCSLVLLGKLVLSTNTFLGDTEVMQAQSEALTTATSIGQSMLEKIVVRGYDHNYPGDNDTVTASQFVLASSLGIDAGETAGKDTSFNDLDDFKSFRDTIDTPRFGKFLLSCKVYYANETSPYDSTGSRTFLKRVDVTVDNAYLVNPTDPLKFAAPITVSRYVAYD